MELVVDQRVIHDNFLELSNIYYYYYYYYYYCFTIIYVTYA